MVHRQHLFAWFDFRSEHGVHRRTSGSDQKGAGVRVPQHGPLEEKL